MSDVITTAAEFVLGQAGWIDRTRARHVPDGDGECAGCPARLRPQWPCVQIAIADRAEELLVAARADHAAASRPVAGR